MLSRTNDLVAIISEKFPGSEKICFEENFLEGNGKKFFPSYSLDDVEKNMQNIAPDYSGCLPQIFAGDNSLDPTQATEPRATFTLQMELAAAYLYILVSCLGYFFN